MDTIAILDFGSQYTQLIARRVRESHVYCEILPWDVPEKRVKALEPKGIILSGGPASVFAPEAPKIPQYLFNLNKPILGICYGMQAITYALGGQVESARTREFGQANLSVDQPNPLLPEGQQKVWMSHGDRIKSLPEGFIVLGHSENSPIAAMGDLSRKIFGIQFHPEVHHTPQGTAILQRFVVDICAAEQSWTPASIIEDSIAKIQQQVGGERVLSAVSGGVDSTVATALTQKAVGDQLAAVFVDTGLLRQGEAQFVPRILRDEIGIELICVDASKEFFQALSGVHAPEEKRRIIGELFIRTFEEQARRLDSPRFLVQGTIYPDVIESSKGHKAGAQRIKTHHNVGGIPEQMNFELVEPLRLLFKDEVRRVGAELGLPAELLSRQPFPGPGLAVRCLGEVTKERIQRLRAADAIMREELANANLLQMTRHDDGIRGSAQAFVVLLPVRSVGVMGDQRTYQEVAAIRAVTSEDFMTADWARFPYEILAKISNRIVNEVDGINRVVYDITSKPPATIEWE